MPLSPRNRASAQRADPFAAIARPLARTRRAMAAERALRAFWPLVSLGLAGWALWAFDIPALVPGMAGVVAVWAYGVAVIVALVQGLRGFRWPQMAEAAARLDRTLPGRPLAALTDSLALGARDSESAALWAAHLGRMAAVAQRARPVPADLRLRQRDPYGLRLMAATVALVALVFATGERRGEISVLPGAAGAAIGPAWEGWLTPPPHTGRPGLYLNEIDRPSFEVPQGTRVLVRFYGAPGALSLAQEMGGNVQFDEVAQTVEFVAVYSGFLGIDGPGGRSWQVVVLRDEAPTVEFSGPLSRGRGGTLTQTFTARDDHGVTFGEAEITLDLAAVERTHGLAVAPEARAPLRLDLPLPMTRNRAEFTETLREDLSQHPWANLPVQIVLRVTDAAGQSGESPALSADLPARRFFEPAAQAIAEIRRDLLWSRENAARSAQLMRAMLHRGQGAFRVDAAPGILREAINLIEARLEAGSFPTELRDELAADLWELALLIEEGELANARDRLRRAQERLDEAMRNGADPEEIAELMDELREATRDYMRMLAEQAEDSPQRGDQRDQGGEQMEITQSQIQELMDRIQELMEEGRMDEAAELMAQLNALLENLQMTRGEGGDPMPGSEAMEGLGETLGDQQALADETFRNLQDQFNRGDPQGEGEGEGQQGEGARDQGTLEDLARRQQELRDRLREQQLQTLPGEGTAEGEAALDALEEAQRAMEDAARALEQGDARGALERQAEAMDALREGLRELGDALAQDRRDADRFAADPNGQGQGAGRDPLGRESGESALGGDLGSGLPGADPRARARDLLDEIRRRSAERERPEDERDYLNRLIERF